MARTKPTHHFVSIAEAAAHSDVCSRTMRRYVSRGLITGYRVGPRLLKVDLNEVEAKLMRPIPAGELDHLEREAS